MDNALESAEIARAVYAANSRDGVVVCSLSSTSFTHYGYMPFVDYSN